MKLTCLARSRDVRIKGESGIHDDTKICDLSRTFDVITCNFDGWDHLECAFILGVIRMTISLSLLR